MSGNGCHTIQNIAANQPSYRTSDSNLYNKPCVFFNGIASTTGLTAPCPNLASLSSFTICMVLYIHQTTFQQTLISSQGYPFIPEFYKLLMQANGTRIQSTLYISNCATSNWFTDSWPYICIITASVDSIKVKATITTSMITFLLLLSQVLHPL